MSSAIEQPSAQDRDGLHTFWVSTFPFFESVLTVVPPNTQQNEWNLKLSFFDPDGAPINAVEQLCPAFEPTIVALDQYLGGCKLESGFKHAQLVVSVPSGAFVSCRLQGLDTASFIGPLLTFTEDRAAFLPVTFSAERSYLIALSNFAGTESSVRCRLICGKRAPETVLQLPPRGSRLLSLSSTFPQFAIQEGGSAVQGYIRLTTRSEIGVGVQLIERTELVGGEGFSYGGLGL